MPICGLVGEDDITLLRRLILLLIRSSRAPRRAYFQRVIEKGGVKADSSVAASHSIASSAASCRPRLPAMQSSWSVNRGGAGSPGDPR